jgi:hypothetical protein
MTERGANKIRNIGVQVVDRLGATRWLGNLTAYADRGHSVQESKRRLEDMKPYSNRRAYQLETTESVIHSGALVGDWDIEGSLAEIREAQKRAQDVNEGGPY